jgi:hypothetical protein
LANRELAALARARIHSANPRRERPVWIALRKWFDQFWDQALASFQDEVERSIEIEKEKKP